jgi:hypothetical protein
MGNIIIMEEQSDEYSLSAGLGCTEVRFTSECPYNADMVRFNIRGSDIFIEFAEEGKIQLQGIPIKFRARLVRERFLKLFFEGMEEEVLATMPMF